MRNYSKLFVLIFTLLVLSYIHCFAQIQSDTSDAYWSVVIPVPVSKDINMGQAQVGETKYKIEPTFLNNSSGYKVSIDSIYFKGVDSNQFGIAKGVPPYTIIHGDQKAVEFTFSPAMTGPKSATIVIITQSDTLEQTITGEGVDKQLEITTKIVDFGRVEVSDSKNISEFVIKNVSSSSIDITSTDFIIPENSQFNVITNGQFTLQPGDTKQMEFQFKPTMIGRTSKDVGFYYNGVGSPATVQLFGSGIGAQISASYDSAYVGEIIDANIKLESGNLTKFAELIGSFDGVFRVENSILAPINKNDLNRMQNDSAYIKFSGNVNPKNSTLSTIAMKAGLGRVEETSIDFESINWYDSEGNLLDYDTEFSSGHFRLLGICREGGTRLVNPNAQSGMMTIAPNPAENKLDISLLMTEKGQTEICIYNVLGEVVQTLFSEDVVQYNTREISTDLSGLSTGQYLIILKTPTYVESSRLMIIK